jgi:hypothetical protein
MILFIIIIYLFIPHFILFYLFSRVLCLFPRFIPVSAIPRFIPFSAFYPLFRTVPFHNIGFRFRVLSLTVYLLRRPFKKIKLVGNERKATQAFVSNFKFKPANGHTQLLITGCMACGGGSLPFVVMAAFQKRFSSSSNARKS